MNENNFDDLIKGKLNKLTQMKSDSNWSSFETKLKNSEVESNASDDNFDNTVKNHLLSNRPPFNSAHWRMLKEHLKTTEERKNTVYVSKALELAAIFLTVVTLIHISGENNKPLFLSGHKSIIAENLKTSGNTINELSADTYPKATGETFDQGKVDQSFISNSPLFVTAFSFKTENNNKTNSSGNYYNNNAETTTSSHLDNIQANDETITLNNPGRLFTRVDNLVKMTRVDLLSFPRIGKMVMKPVESEMSLIIPLSQIKENKKASFYISAWAATDVNLINTPFDKFYSLASYTKEALNNSYGLNFSSRNSNIEIESGIGYSMRVYQPQKITEAYGVFGEHYFEKSLNKISFDIATVPFNIKYHTLNGAGWSVYFMAGAALNVVLNAEYDISETLVRGRPPVGRYVPEIARLDRKPFIEGVLNGDKFRDNYFATVGFGFGIEKNIFRSTSIYIQPSYFRQVLSADVGIGPNKDKIHSSSLQIGFKSVIK